MQLTKKGIDLIKRFEGFSSKPYLCAAGVPTIGYGNTFYENGTKVTLNDSPITLERGEELLWFVVSVFADKVANLIKVPISNNQFSALVSLTYNIGMGNFASSTLLKKLNAGDYQGAADQILRWNRARGKESLGLTNRRIAERELFVLG